MLVASRSFRPARPSDARRGGKVGMVVRVRTLVITGVATVAMAAVAVAATHGASASHVPLSTPFRAQGLLTPSGNPEPAVGYYPDGAAGVMHWSMCAPPGTGTCEVIRSNQGLADPGPEPAGTVFKVTATYQGHAYASSIIWHGAVRAATRPILSGRTRYGATVTGAAARWTGGWGTEVDQLGIEACRTVRATGCVMLSGNELQCSPRGCGVLGGVTGPLDRPNRARIGNWYTGWYLFALDAHTANGLSGLVGYSSPAAISPWPTNATVIRSKPYGPVTGPPPPRVRILPDVQVRGNHVVVASVQCAVSCHAWVMVSRIGKHFGSGERVGWSANKVIEGSAMLGVWGSIPPGHVAVTVNVGDGPYLNGHSLLR
jgi:hypothetical protein